MLGSLLAHVRTVYLDQVSETVVPRPYLVPRSPFRVPRTMIRARCSCGEVYTADDKHLGRRVRCRCGEMVELLDEVPEPPRRRRKPASQWGELWQSHAREEARPRARGESRRGWLGRFRSRLRREHRDRPLFSQRDHQFDERKQRVRTRVRSGKSRRRFPFVRLTRGDHSPLTRWLTWISLGYLGITLITWLALRVASESVLPVTAYLYGPRWVLLVPALVLAILAIMKRRALLVPIAVGALIVLGPIMGLRLGAGDASVASADAARLRAVTINAGGLGLSTFGLAVLMREENPDIVAIQECSEVVAEYVRELNDWYTHETPGMCLISRYPIARAEVMDRKVFERVQETGRGGSSQAVRYQLAGPRGLIYVANIHLETARKGLGGLLSLDTRAVAENRMLREIESQQIFAWLRPFAERLIVLGDFNMPVESEFYRAAWAGYRNAFDEVGRGYGMTRNTRWIRARIDHVLTGDEWAPVRARVGPDVGSDHLPMIADLRRAVRS